MKTTERISRERFYSKFEQTQDNQCWEWRGLKDKDGYGRHRPGAGLQYSRAHRFSWEIHYGPIPKGICVLHICDNPACVNPEHLALGNNRENVEDMVKKNRQSSGDRHARRIKPELFARGVRVPLAKLNDAKVIEIRRLSAEGISGASIARKYGVAKITIQRILKGKGWTHVKNPLPLPREA